MKYNLKEKTASFFKELSKLERESKKILSENENDPDKLDIEKKIWTEKVIKYISENIEPSPNDLIDKFRYSENETNSMFFHFGKSYDKSPEGKISYSKNQFNYRVKKFKKLVAYLSIIDSFKKNQNIIVQEIKSIKDKLDYILEKLHFLYGDDFYSIGTILTINEIETRENENIEICNNLAKKGYVIREEEYSNKDNVQISIKGAEYIERKVNSKKKNSLKNEKTNSDFNAKIELVLEKLIALDLGQEIIFNEINELKDLSKIIPKKNLTQLIKGKLLDLAFSKLISKDVASFIYETLTDDKLKLL